MTQFLRDQASDSEEVVTPLMLDGTYLSRNFATLGPLTWQPPCGSFPFLSGCHLLLLPLLPFRARANGNARRGKEDQTALAWKRRNCCRAVLERRWSLPSCRYTLSLARARKRRRVPTASDPEKRKRRKGAQGLACWPVKELMVASFFYKLPNGSWIKSRTK